MQIYDRLKDCFTESSKLPDRISLGRYLIRSNSRLEELCSLSEGVDSTKHIFEQSILLENRKDEKDLLNWFYENEFQNKDFSLSPILKSFELQKQLTEFEVQLKSALRDLEAIVRSPHCMLSRTQVKVKTGQAKRILPISYNYLTYHTEDWQVNNLVNFLPKKIYTEESVLNYDVYENQVVCCFVQKSIKIIKGLLATTETQNSFFDVYKKVFDKFQVENSWHEKLRRNCVLLGKGYPLDSQTDRDNLTEIQVTYQQLIDERKGILHRLKKLQSSELFDVVDKKRFNTLLTQAIYSTNVFVNNVHYRRVRKLCNFLSEYYSADESEGEFDILQSTIKGLRSYAKVLIEYTFKNIIGEQWFVGTIGSYNEWRGENFLGFGISLSEDEFGILKITIDDCTIRCCVIEGGSDLDNEIQDQSVDNFLILRYSMNGGMTENSVDIHPYDVDSCERLGKILRRYILDAQMRKFISVKRDPRVPSSLIKFSELFKSIVVFDGGGYYFSTTNASLNTEAILEGIKRDRAFSDMSSKDRSAILKDAQGFLTQLNEKQSVKSFFCPCCGATMNGSFANLNGDFDLICSNASCGFHLRCKNNQVKFFNPMPQYQSLSPSDWGADFVDFDYIR